MDGYWSSDEQANREARSLGYAAGYDGKPDKSPRGGNVGKAWLQGYESGRQAVSGFKFSGVRSNRKDSGK